MSKRVVLATLLVLAGAPMLTAGTAPVGVAAATAGIALLVLPRLGRTPI